LHLDKDKILDFFGAAQTKGNVRLQVITS
jgi:hypothetical protein